MLDRPLGRWHCLAWPLSRLAVWVIAVIVLVIEIQMGVDLPTAIAVALAAIYVSQAILHWIGNGSTGGPAPLPGPRRP